MADQSRFFSSDNDAGIQQAATVGRSALNFNPNYPITLMSALYDGKDTIVRLLPYFDTTVKPYEEVPYRSGARFSPWYRSFPAMKSIGSSSTVTVYLNDPQKNRSWDKNSNPLVILQREIAAAVDHAQKANGSFPDQRRLYHGGAICPHYWGGLIKGESGKGAAIPRPTSIVIAHVLVYQHGKKLANDGPPIGLRDGDTSVIFEFTGAFWQDVVIKQLNQLKANYQGNPDDLEAAYENGDPISLAHGRFLHIYKIGCDPRQSVASPDNLAIYSNSGKQSGGREIAGYDGFFSRTAPGYPLDNGTPAKLIWPAPHDVISQTIRDRFVPLDQVVEVLSPVDQAKAVYSLFPPEVLMYAWEKYPQFITDELKKIAQAQMAVNVTTPAAPPAAATGPWSPAASYPSPYTAAPSAAPAAPAGQPWGPPASAAAPVAAAPWVQPPAPAPAAPYAPPAAPSPVPMVGFNSGPEAAPAPGPWPAAPAAVDPGAAHLQSPGDFTPPAPPVHTVPVNTSPLPVPPVAAPSNIDMLKQASNS